jgi:hypothetical protein
MQQAEIIQNHENNHCQPSLIPRNPTSGGKITGDIQTDRPLPYRNQGRGI